MAGDQSPSNPLAGAMLDVFDSLMRQMMFCLPGKVLAFNPDDQTAQIQCGLQRNAGGAGITIPTIDAVPVHFPGDNDYHFWHEIKPGCEGLIHFSQRSIDEWRDRGGPTLPADKRAFSLQDAFFVPGFRSRKNSIPNFRNSGAGISSKNGSTYVWVNGTDVKAVGVNVEAEATAAATVKAPAITLDGNVAITGALAVAGAAAIAGALTNAGTNVGADHFHNQPNDSAGNSQSPTGPPQ